MSGKWGPPSEMAGNGGSGTISTLHISGFPMNTNDREMENFCRFFPGFVAAKANLSKGQPKVWVRFDTPQNALQALPYIDGQPFDLRDPSTALWAAAAKTDLNPDSSPRMAGACTVVGPLDEILSRLCGGDDMPDGGDGKGNAPPRPGWKSDGPWGKRPMGDAAPAPMQNVPGGPLTTWPPKKPRLEAPSSADELDTLVVFKPGEAGITDNALHEYFIQLEGYKALRMGGANCFVKFTSPAAAQAALPIASQAGVQVELAKTNMNENQATHRAMG